MIESPFKESTLAAFFRHADPREARCAFMSVERFRRNDWANEASQIAKVHSLLTAADYYGVKWIVQNAGHTLGCMMDNIPHARHLKSIKFDPWEFVSYLAHHAEIKALAPELLPSACRLTLGVLRIDADDESPAVSAAMAKLSQFHMRRNRKLDSLLHGWKGKFEKNSASRPCSLRLLQSVPNGI